MNEKIKVNVEMLESNFIEIDNYATSESIDINDSINIYIVEAVLSRLN